MHDSITRSGVRRRDLLTTDEDTKKIERAAIMRAAAEIKHTIPSIEEALRKNRGSVAKAAEELGVLRQALKRKIDNNPYLVNVQRDIKETLLDNTEQKLLDLVDEKNPTAVTFHLRTQGKERGYTEKNTLEHDVTGTLGSAAALIGAMRKGADGVEDENLIEVEDSEWSEDESL